MKSLATIVFVVFSAVFFTSCDEYSSPVPAGKLKESKVDTNYTGYWDFVGLDNDADTTLSNLNPHFMSVERFDQNRYLLIMVKKDSVKTTSPPEAYEATTCIIGGKKIASVRALLNSDEKNEYLIYQFDVYGDTLCYQAFQKSKLDKQFNKTSAVKKYLLKYLNDTSVLLPRKKYVRIK